MTALPHQIKKAQTIIRKLRLYGLALFAGEVRSGKTAAFILAADKLSHGNYLVITKKGAIEGVKKFTPNVTNYHQAHKIDHAYTVVILDECHRYITGYPKRSQIWKNVHKVCKSAQYIIFSSGTPTPESMAMLFNMLALSKRSPWHMYNKYADWHKDYGVSYKIKIGAHYINQWDRVKESEITNAIEHLKVSMTRKEAGHKYEPVDKLHEIDMTKQQEVIYKALKKDRLHDLDPDYAIVCDTPSKYLQKLHQVSGGFVNAVDLKESTKIFSIPSNKTQYIKDNFAPDDTIILAYYIAEQEHLAKYFPHVGSITKNSDGVDYSHFKNMVIYSMGFSAATYQQIIGRQLNFITRQEEVIIHFLITGIDRYVYDAVSNKQSFTSKWYNERKHNTKTNY